jgi:hypothetical protein
VGTCPTLAADANHDGTIDLIETEATSGSTMVPFNGVPAALQIPTETYPKASAKGSYGYEKTVSLIASAAVRNYPLHRIANHVASAPLGIDERPVRGAVGMVADGALGIARTKSGDDWRSGSRQSRMVVLAASIEAKAA